MMFKIFYYSYYKKRQKPKLLKKAGKLEYQSEF